MVVKIYIKKFFYKIICEIEIIKIFQKNGVFVEFFLNQKRIYLERKLCMCILDVGFYGEIKIKNKNLIL